MEYLPDQTFCKEADVFRVGGYRWTPSSIPTDAEVYEFARKVRGEIVLATQRAGRRFEPPASAVADDDLREVLIEANATGAAYRAWRTMASKNPDDFAVQMRNQLREDWVRFVGGTTASGEEVSGTITAAIETSSNSRAISNDVTEGETTLPTRAGEEVDVPFRMNDAL